MKKILFVILLLPVFSLAQQTIEGHFSPAESFSFVLLYHVTPTGTNYINQAKTDENGYWTFSLDTDAKKGLYKVVYAVPIEENNFDIFYNGNEDISLTFDIASGLSFKTSKENKTWQIYTDSISKINGQISNYYMSQKTNKSEITSIFKTLKATQNHYEAITANMMISPFVTSNRTYIPDSYEPVNTYSLNLKKHFFDYIAFENPLLQSSNFLNQRIRDYVFAMPDKTSYYTQAIDDVVTAIGNHDTVKIQLLKSLWQDMLNSQKPEVANYISDTYLLPLAKEQQKTDLVKILEDYNKTAIGKKAQNFSFTYLKNNKAVKTNLYEFNKTKSTLLVFWSSGCSHCLQELPKVKTLMDKHPEVVVLAYGLEDRVRNWNQTISQFPNFIHTYDLQKWNSPLISAYGVTATPSYFMLDSDKTIIAKPEHVEDLQIFFKE